MSNPMKDIFDKESTIKDIAERENIICTYQKYGLLDRENAIKKIQELRRGDDNVAAITSVQLATSSVPFNQSTNDQLVGELKDVNGKKYGLVFEEHREEIDEVLDTHTPVLTEDKDLFIDNGGQMNFIIEGDNLASLKLLEKTHKGKIDLIYIDPPYNTGNKDFVYDDKFVVSEDGFRHSKYASFLKKRLEAMRKLLSSQGYICISIDDNEQPDIRFICDEVFGESNFIEAVKNLVYMNFRLS